MSDIKNKFENFVNKTKKFAGKVKDGVVKNTQKFKKKIKLSSIEKTKEKFDKKLDKNESPRKFYLPAVLPEQQNVTNAELKAKETSSKSKESTPKTATKKEKVTPTQKKAIQKKPEAKESSTQKAVKSVPKKKNLPSTEIKYDKIFGLNNSNSETKDNSTPVEKVEPKTTEQNDSKEKEQIDKDIDNDSTQPTDHTKVEKVETELLDSNEYKKFNDADIDYTDSNEDIIDAEFTDVKDHKEEPKDSEIVDAEIVNEEEKSESKPDAESEIKDETPKIETINEKGEEELKDKDTDKSLYPFEKAKDYYHVDLSKKEDSEKFTGTPVVDFGVDESKKEEAPKSETIEKTKEDIKDSGSGESKTKDKEESSFSPELDTDLSHGFTDTAELSPTDKTGSFGTAGLPPKDEESPKSVEPEPPKEKESVPEPKLGSTPKQEPEPPKKREPFEIRFDRPMRLLGYVLLAGALFGANPMLLFFGLFLMGAQEVLPPIKIDSNKGLLKKIWDKFDLDNISRKQLYKDKNAEKNIDFKKERKSAEKLAKLYDKKEKALLEEKDQKELARLREKKNAGKKLSKDEKKDLAKLSKKEHEFDKFVKKYDKTKEAELSKAKKSNKTKSDDSLKYEIYSYKASNKIQQQNDSFNKQREQFQNEIASQIKETENAIKLVESGKLSEFGKEDVNKLKNDLANLRAKNHEASVLKNPEYEHNAIIEKKLDIDPFDKSACDAIKDSVDFSKTCNDKISELGLDKSSGTIEKIKASEDYKKVIEASKSEKKVLESTELSTGE